MTVHDITEGTRTPKRHEKWREDWTRRMFSPKYDSGGKSWEVDAGMMLATCRPFNALFELRYGRDDLLEEVTFRSKYSDAPATEWAVDGPEMRELVTQIMLLYLRRWPQSPDAAGS
jgi:hypothetical protein